MSLKEGNSSGQETGDYRYVEGPPRLDWLCERAGLMDPGYLDSEFMREAGMAALYELFSDGEITVRPVLGGINPDRLTDIAVRHGEFYAGFKTLLENVGQDTELQDELNKLARVSGDLFARQQLADPSLPIDRLLQPSFLPASGEVLFEFMDYCLKLPNPHSTVLEYGPGVAAIRFINLQIEALSHRRNPLQYIAVSKGPFINQYLLTYLSGAMNGVFGSGVASQFLHAGLFVGREDGMKETTQHILATSQPGGTHEMTDVIMLCAVHYANPSDLKFTIQQSVKLLKPEGKLLVAAPIPEVRPGMTTFNQQIDWAKEVGYKIEWEEHYPTGDIKLGTNTTSGCAVLRK